MKVILRSNFRHYYNIRFLDEEKPDAGIYFYKGDFWSLSVPYKKPIDDGDRIEKMEPVEPPVELERRGGDYSLSRQVSPVMSMSNAGSSSIRSDRVYRLPQDDSLSLLSPKSRKRAKRLRLPPQQSYMRSAIARSLAPPPDSATPQARLSGFLEKVLLGKK